MSKPNISKYFFKNLNSDIYNLYYTKQIPFLAWSDLESTDYAIIGNILDRIKLNKSLLLSVGQTQAPFGMTVNPTGQDLNNLLNSCKYSFIMTDKLAETDYLLKCVLANITPICNTNHCMIEKLGLGDFSCNNTYEEMIDKLCEIKYYNRISNRYINLLTWKYNLQLKKWYKSKES